MAFWVLKELNGLPVLTAAGMSGATVAFSTRNGGVGTGDYRSLNLALHVADREETVKANRAIFMRSLGFSPEDMVCCQQVHGGRVLRVGARERGRGAFIYGDALPDADALITNETGPALCTFYADCIPLFFYDEPSRCIGLAHAGWKGTVADIARHTLEAMAREYGMKKDTVRAFIGPGIGPCCFEVGAEVARRVRALYAPWYDLIVRNREGRYYWDLKLTNMLLMKEWGVKAENLCCSEYCSACAAELFFSYRREQGKTGRMAALIALTHAGGDD